MTEADQWADGWKLRRLNEVADVAAGTTAPQGNEYFEGGAFPFVRAQDVGRFGRTNCLTDTKDKVNAHAVAAKRLKLARKGAVVFPKSGASILTNSRAKLGVDAYVVSHLAIIAASPKFLDDDFLYHWLCTLDMSKSVQSDEGYPSLRLSDISAFEIPVPPLAEQRRLVARIEGLTNRFEQARDLRSQITKEVEDLLRSLVFNDEDAKPTRMRNLLRLRSTDVAVQKIETYQFAGVYSFGRGVFRSVAKPGRDFAYARLTRVKAGEFTYPKLMAWEGALGMVPPECDGCVVSPEFPVFEVDTDRVFPEVLDVYFRTPSVWPKLAGLSTGTNVRRRRLNPQEFLDYEIAIPSRRTQLKVRAAYAKQTELRRLQKETEAELAAFTPALLAKAFRGKL